MELQFPIGIDSDRFIRALENPLVQEHMKELKERFSGRKVSVYFQPTFLDTLNCHVKFLTIFILATGNVRR